MFTEVKYYVDICINQQVHDLGNKKKKTEILFVLNDFEKGYRHNIYCYSWGTAAGKL